MELQEIAPGLWHWTAPHPEWTPKNRGENGEGWEQMVSSYALVADGRFVLFDPQVPEDESEAAELWRALDGHAGDHGPPAVLITIYWHGRSAPQIAERYESTRIWVAESAAEQAVKAVAYTDTYRDGDELPGGIRAREFPRLEEAVFELPVHRALVFGDAVLDGPRLCPPDWLPKGVPHEELADAVRPLMQNAELLLLTHGGPTAAAALEV